jgi:hypothetical protein
VERGGLEEGQTLLGLPCEIRAYGEITKREYVKIVTLTRIYICPCIQSHCCTLEIAMTEDLHIRFSFKTKITIATAETVWTRVSQ